MNDLLKMRKKDADDSKDKKKERKLNEITRKFIFFKENVLFFSTNIFHKTFNNICHIYQQLTLHAHD